ncbi:hypothetical protein FISHEDRAFT_34965, partial [Fistulina hepatica ATCC 64428]
DTYEQVTKPMKQSSSITAAFEHKGGGKTMYSTHQHTKTETNFQNLIKMGQPKYYIPSCMTVSHDVKHVFQKMCARDHNGILSFVTDMWTSLNHKAYMGNTIMFEHDEHLITLVLDIVEVAKA